MTRAVDHLYLSPHFDDAVLSCGGMIHGQTRAGRRVVVATVCAGDPPAGPISPYAAGLHARWGLPAEGGTPAASMVALRRAEDAAALSRLGADGVYLDVPDVIYRQDRTTGEWIVWDDDSLFGGDRSYEPSLVADLAWRIGMIAPDGSPAVYAPLAVGNHVDHWLVRRAAEAWAEADAERRDRLAYYEDYPYSEQPGAVKRVVGTDVGDPGRAAGNPVLAEEALPPSTPLPAWRSGAIELTEADLAAKIDAIAAYVSQISSFWVDTAAMAEAVRAFALSRGRGDGAAERLWFADRPG